MAGQVNRLPEMQDGMPIDQALFLELLAILVDEGILTDEKAVKRYRDRRVEFGVKWLRVVNAYGDQL